MYRVKLTRKAEKQYDHLTSYRKKINGLLEFLENTAYPAKEYDLVKLSGSRSAYRIRIGKVRIKYFVNKDEKTVIVYHIGLRSETTYK